MNSLAVPRWLNRMMKPFGKYGETSVALTPLFILLTVFRLVYSELRLNKPL